MSIPEPILLLGAERVAKSEESLLPKLNSVLCELTERRYAKKTALIEIDYNGCWNWGRGLTASGYGEMTLNYKVLRVHRYFYLIFKKEIPKGLQLDHLCRNRKCCNPNHLEPVTNKENAARSERATRTHCINGHPFNDWNTYITKTGGRMCKECRRIRMNKYSKIKREKRDQEIK